MFLTDNELDIARRTVDFALRKGASQVRVTLSKSVTDLVGMLDGETDKITHALDRSLQIALFVDGRYGAFSTNRLEEPEIQSFLDKAIGMVRMLAEDPCRSLPDPSRTVKNAVSGDELSLTDPYYESVTPSERLSLAKRSSCFSRRETLEKGFKMLSEEGEYSDSISESVIIDSNGLFARQRETSFEIGYETTLEAGGERFSGYWWDAAPRLDDVRESILTCSEKAVQRAAAQIGPRRHKGGKMNLVVDSECSSRLVSPILSALGGFSLQQKNSFLDGRIGEKVFSSKMNLMDRPFAPGRNGSRLFDSEGVASKEMPIIENGIVKTSFINTYIANKTGWTPTVEDPSRPVLSPVGGCRNLPEILSAMDEGILVTGFNGGNSNSTTGAFSYGIEGFFFKGGKIVHPVREMLMTGDFIGLWNNLALAGEDSRLCMSKLIPTLAFENVDLIG